MATITVTKGYNDPSGFTSGEIITPAKLNSAQSPAVAVADIVNADISASAAIAKSKLALTDQIVDADIKSDAAIAGSKLADGAIGSTQLADGAIGSSKLADAAVTAAKLNGTQTGAAPIYGVRAWVAFDGTRNEADDGSSSNDANVKIINAGNVSSVFRHSTGNYTINFAEELPTDKYSFAGSSDHSGSNNSNLIVGPTRNHLNAITQSACRVYIQSTAGNAVAPSYCSLMFIC